MKKVSDDELVALLTQHRPMAQSEPLAVEHDGQVIGYYLPVPARRSEEIRRAMDHLERTLARVAAETGLTEDELAGLFDLTRPLPETPDRRQHIAHAPRS
jgi:hypothetical protein